MHPDTKSRICHFITGSRYFDLVLKEKRIYLHEIYEKLIKTEPSLILTLYEPPPGRTSGSELIYTNRNRKVSAHRKYGKDKSARYEEFVFTCLTAKVQSGKEAIKSYLVSVEYNLSDTPSSHIGGRFVFVYVDPNQSTEVKIFAVAEEPAKSIYTSSTLAERSYLQERMENELSKLFNCSLPLGGGEMQK